MAQDDKSLKDVPEGEDAYQHETLEKIRQHWETGVGVLKNEQGYIECQANMEYIEGKQQMIRTQSLSKVHDNRLKKVSLEVCAAMTDVRPIWNYNTIRNDMKPVGESLNRLARAWWKNGRTDRKLEDGLMFGMAGGSGYLALTWDPDVQDLVAIPFDPRDVVPIDPVYSDSCQDWQGIILRSRVSKEWLKDKYPAKASKIDASDLNSWGDRDTRSRGSLTAVVSAFWSAIKGAKNRNKIEKAAFAVDLLRVYIKDYRVNETEKPVRMGKGNWAYNVPPGEKLYPRGRMVICTPQVILEDQPNPYIHGKFPVVKFTLDPVPWNLLGLPILSDLKPLQDMLNSILRAMDDGVKQWARRGVVTDMNSMTDTNLKKLDTRRDGLKVQLNPTMGDGFKMLDGPNFPTWMAQLIEFLRNEVDDNSGVIGLRQQQNMKTMLPDKDTITQFEQALSPILKRRARGMECALAELAEMVKFGFFQYYTREKRISILGDNGKVEEEFLFKPNELIPSGEVDNDDYANSLQRFAQQFTFTVAPNSFLNVSHAAQRMMILQLFRANGIDIWSLWESMDLANIGEIPEGSLADRMIEARKNGLQPGPTPEMVEATNKAQLAQAQLAGLQAEMAVLQLKNQQARPQYGGGEGGGEGGPPAPPPGGAPPTSGVGPQGGRPPSGQQPPQMVQKSDGRTVVSESGG